MTTAQTTSAENRGQAWRARWHSRGSYRAAPEVPPVAPVDRYGRRRGSSIAVRPKVALEYRDAPERMAEGTAV